MDRLTSMGVFVRVVARGSFAGAAADLGISPTMVGLHIRALEDRLGSRLIARTTRRQSLTETGRAYHDHCRRILADIDAAEASAQAFRTSPRGLLRITAPVTFGVHALTPALADFMAHYAEIEVDLVLSDRVLDLVEEGFDAAIRIGDVREASLIARSLRPYRMVLCAAPDYLERCGTPEAVPDLAAQRCLGFSYWREQDRWRLGDAEVSVNCRFRANNGEALRQAALRGMGIVLQPEALLAGDLAAGRLTRLLPQVDPPSRPMHLIYQSDRRATPKLRCFVDFALSAFGRGTAPAGVPVG